MSSNGEAAAACSRVQFESDQVFFNIEVHNDKQLRQVTISR